MGTETGIDKGFKSFRLTRMPEHEPLSPGHRACQGCGEILALRQVMKALGDNVIVVSATGCMEIVTSPFPQTAWRVPWLHVAFENASAVVSGVESAYKAMGRKGKIDQTDVVFLAYGGDGATADIGLQSLSGALERGHNFLYVCLDNEAYMNTGIQRSSSTPYGAMTTTSPPGKKSIGQHTWKKNMPAIVAAHGIPYVATASPAFPVDLMNKVKKAAMMPGPAYIHIFSPCPTGWRASPETSVELARMAVLSNVFPLYEVINGKWILSRPERASCGPACPAGIDVQGFINLIAHGRFDEALQLIKQDNPLPAICGRVCHHPCEFVCERGGTGEGAVAIEFLKRFVADLDLQSGKSYVPKKKGAKRNKVAVIGAGPAGLTAAYYLAIEGYPVTIFEAMPEPGGWLTYGIPEFRLARDIMKAEFDAVFKAGVEIKTGITVGVDVTLDALRKEGYEAFFIAVGTHKPLKLDVPGEDLEGVFAGGDFLKMANQGQVSGMGKRVAVIGGGNVAMDSARIALRLGAEEVDVLYRRSRKEMPAGEEEIQEAEEEGIRFQFLTAPVEILGQGGKVTGMRCIRMRLCELDESGRCRPEPIEGSEYSMEVDTVIVAIGLTTDLSVFGKLTDENRPATTGWGTVKIDPVSYQTSVPDVFAAGDVVTGPATVVEAIGAGKEVAISIDRYFKRQDLAAGRAKTSEMIDAPPPVPPEGGRRTAMPKLSGPERKRSFKEVHLGFSEDQAVREARCCLQCGITRSDGGKVRVADYFKLQRRFRHLTDTEIEKIQARVDAEYQALLERCGLR